MVRSIRTTGRADAGRIEHGTYLHDDLMVSIRPPDGVLLRRQSGELTELQVGCTHPEFEDRVEFSIVGFRAVAGAGKAFEESVLQVLSMGAYAARRGVITSDRFDVGGGGGPARVIEWVFGKPGGTEFSSERWIYFAKGRRKFLIRMIARAPTQSEAVRLRQHDRARPFFDAMLGAVVIR